MITLSGGQNAQLFEPHYNVLLNILMVPVGGGVFNPTSHLLYGQIRAGMDQSCGTMTMTFARGTGVDNLSPLILASDWNVNGPLMYGGVFILLSACVVPPGGAPGVFNSIWQGKVDAVDVGGEQAVIVCRDTGANFLDRQIKIEAPYGGPMEDVIPAILAANGFAPADQLIIEGVPDFTLDQYMQQPGSLLEAIRLVAQQRGWDLRFFMSRGKLRCYDPDRERVLTDATITKNDYISVDKLNIDDTDVRNQVRVWYAQNTAAMATYYEEDGPSMFQHGPKFTQLVMRKTPNLSTLDAAIRYTRFALADMKDPLADHQVTMPFFPIVELNDFYEYVANMDHYDQNQKWAISGYTHDFNLAGGTTTLETRGKPMAAFRDYRRGQNNILSVSIDAAPTGTYLDGLVFPEGYQWLKTDDLTIPT